MKKVDQTLAASVSGTAVDAKASSGIAAAADHVLYRSLVDSLTEYAVFAVSPGGIVISWNGGAQKTFGYTKAEIVGKPFDVIFTPQDVAAGAPHREVRSALSGGQTQHDRWHVRKDGSSFWGTNTVQPLQDAAGALIGFTKLVRDTTVSHQALEALSDSEQQLRLLVESVRDYAIFSLSLDGTIKSWNAGAEEVFGYTQADVVGREFAALFSAEDTRDAFPTADLNKAATNGSANVERWLMRKDGSRFLANSKISALRPDAAGEQRGFVNVTHDITAQHAVAQELRRRAQHDELTDLPNRRTFYDNVQRAIGALKRRSSNLFAVLFIDVDHFKSVNDAFGHGVADKLLAVTARRLERCIRSEDIVARIGGDEFAILLNGITGVNDANDAAERIGVQMRQPVTIEQCDVCASVSIGIAIGNPVYDKPEDILRDADSAMYAAKLEGRGRAVLFRTSDIDASVTVDLAGEMHAALVRNELRIAYQPIIRLRDRTLTGFESLVRWQHPRRGLLLPADFIPKTEQSELIISIDRWMLAEGCRQMARWLAGGVDPQFQISINVSSREFSRDDFLAELRRILESSGLAPERLRLEITEGVIMEQSEATRSLLAAIRRLGVSLDVDDFGTGFSSLAALQHMSVDALKIDSTFVSNMSSSNGAKLIETIIVLAQKLDIITIAEGLETNEEAAGLTALGCQYGQGFLFAPPLDASAAVEFATRGHASVWPAVIGARAQ
jgi:diguanylate cyclase (GGDEF)-like protein/PAS domain S-box-containing protein